MVPIPALFGGVAGSAIYIDTEGASVCLFTGPLVIFCGCDIYRECAFGCGCLCAHVFARRMRDRRFVHSLSGRVVQRVLCCTLCGESAKHIPIGV